MTTGQNDAHPAVQYLIWALEEIEKSGDQKAAHHARMALKELRGSFGSADKPHKQTT
jgi:hypothetical protein